jgi:glycosyltransferase involved in cell wall biosynthesis
MARRLRVGVPAVIRDFNPMTGTGNMWRHVLRGLEAHADVVFADPAARRRSLGRNPQVWLSDCGLGAIPVREPLVVQVHEAGWDEPELLETFDPHFVEVILEGMIGDAVRRAARIVAPSESARQQIIAHWSVDPDRVHAVLHGVDADIFRPGRVGGEKLVEAAGGRPGIPYVLFVSSVHPRKNLKALREAMTMLAADGFPHQLVLVAAVAQDRADSGALGEEAERDLAGAGRVVRFTDISEADLADLMAGASAFCLPSLMEGFGMSVLEAMSAGVPVVTSDRGSLPEVVGDAGIVVPPTAADVHKALARVLGEPGLAADLSRRARARALTLTWDRTVEGWWQVLLRARNGC